MASSRFSVGKLTKYELKVAFNDETFSDLLHVYHGWVKFLAETIL
jgi:hypothetical protein